MTPVRAGDVVVAPQRFTHAHRDRLLADIQMGKTRHFGAEIELIDLFLEATDLHHLPIEMNPALIVNRRAFCWLYFVFFGSCHQGIIIGLRVMECWRDAKISRNPLLHSSTLHACHLGQHVKQDREIFFGEPCGARAREQLIGNRRGRQRHIQLKTHLQSEE
jgi:hypothetical protein